MGVGWGGGGAGRGCRGLEGTLRRGGVSVHGLLYFTLLSLLRLYVAMRVTSLDAELLYQLIAMLYGFVMPCGRRVGHGGLQLLLICFLLLFVTSVHTLCVDARCASPTLPRIFIWTITNKEHDLTESGRMAV